MTLLNFEVQVDTPNVFLFFLFLFLMQVSWKKWMQG